LAALQEKDMNSQVEAYFSKQPQPQQEICRKLRDIILDAFPDINEGMKWGVPAFEDGLFYVVALKDHVNLGFLVKKLTDEEEKLFEGGGRTTRKIEIREIDQIDQPRIVDLLRLVKAKK
jgi:hypothetical protein